MAPLRFGRAQSGIRGTMSFLFNNSVRQPRPVLPAQVAAKPVPSHPDAEKFYRELIDQRPALIDEKLKVHARIIDEFNLALLEKMPHEELVRQVRTYVANYVRIEK